MLQRKQLILDDKVTLEMVELARDEGRSFSDLAREALAEKVKSMKKKNLKKPKKNAAALLLESAKRVEKMGWVGPTDLSTNDDYIYG